MKTSIILTAFVVLAGCTVKTEPATQADTVKVSTPTKPVTWDSLVKEFKLMDSLDQLYRDREWPTNDDPYFLAQYQIDSLNTKRILEIVYKHGYPTAERLKKQSNAAFILLHSPPSYFKAIDEMLELKKDTIYPDEYKILKWHLTGRPGQLK